MHKVDLLRRDMRANAFVMQLFDMPSHVAAAAILFGGDRWSCVEVVAMLSVNGKDAGIATLSPTREDGKDEPTVVALWIDPELRSHPEYISYGVEMLKTLAGESVRLYGRIATFATVTLEEQNIAEEAIKQSVDFIHVRVTQHGVDW